MSYFGKKNFPKFVHIWIKRIFHDLAEDPSNAGYEIVKFPDSVSGMVLWTCRFGQVKSSRDLLYKIMSKVNKTVLFIWNLVKMADTMITLLPILTYILRKQLSRKGMKEGGTPWLQPVYRKILFYLALSQKSENKAISKSQILKKWFFKI